MKIKHWLKWVKYVLWRWYFTKRRLPRVIHGSLIELQREYREYCQMVWDKGLTAMSFEDWCGTKVGYSDET